MENFKPSLLLAVYSSLVIVTISQNFPFDTNRSTNCSVRLARMTIKVEDCFPVNIRAKVCSGTCPSYTMTSSDKPQALETKCECCQYVGKKRKRFAIRCPHKVQEHLYKVAIASVTIPRRCMCRPCSDAPNRLLSAEKAILRRNPILDILRINSVFR
ncbi:hypothetical protein ACF0H5_015255 [Mactra antiquata]